MHMLIQRRYEYTERNDTRPTSPRDIMVCGITSLTHLN